MLFRGVCEGLKAMHNYRVPTRSGHVAAKKAKSKARRIREEGARADREAADAHGANDDDDDEAEVPLMGEEEVTMAQDGVADGEIRAYAHRDIKPGMQSLSFISHLTINSSPQRTS